MKTADFLQTALYCLRRGWAVFPVVQGGKVPLTARGFKDASSDEGQVNRWASRNPTANAGIATGKPSGIVVIDVDVKNGKGGLASLELIKGLVPKDTYTVRTPSGGLHYYYRMTTAVKSKNNFMDGIDVKADGGYVVAPGSEIDGKPYECIVETSLREFLPALMSIPMANKVESPPPPPRRLHMSGSPDLARAKRVRFSEITKVKAGKILCPFHPDKNPSALVNRHEDCDICYCFACNKSFDVISYIRKVKGITFREALRELC